ncbi:DUF6493 family protein [uncultured Roseobacter sp.]|uniref:DUF6493 family protein n=1 Tax=uncultured Roseobacter sp. TaxID=114847 RepID=UPI002616B46B|nr:DUF6493 family protein [uncultured Roseobacter sp.]
MTEEEVLGFICAESAVRVLNLMSGMPWSDRRKHAKAVIRLFKDTISVFHNEPGRPKVKDDDAVVIAVLATATLSDLKALRLWQLPGKPRIDEVLRVLQPDWVEEWVTDLIEHNPHIVPRLAPVWETGLCPRPTSDAFILGYYAQGYVSSDGELEEDVFFSTDVWRFFEVEGGGEFSLAACDKYLQPSSTWAHRLLNCAETGKLDRGRLLDASLDALDRDFGQFVAGWYSRFHSLLKPAPEEIAERAPRYLRLLSSSVPPTVTFAVKAVQIADKARAISPAALLDALEPALQARAKGTVTAALRLVASAAKRDPSLSLRAAGVATSALVSEDAGVQDKALDLIETLGGTQDVSIRSAVAEFVPLAAPSVRARMAALSGLKQVQPDDLKPVRHAVAASVVSPVTGPEDALALFLSVLENHRDPFAVERAVDGLARFGAALRKDSHALSPLKKRARQFFENRNDSVVRLVLAVTGCDLAEGTLQHMPWHQREMNAQRPVLIPGTFGRLLMDRNAEILAQVMSGHSVPMLSLPSDTSGHISADDLVSRLKIWRDKGLEPGNTDLQLALLRLAPESRAEALQDFSDRTETGRAVMYALGADEQPGSNAALWAAAWAARQPGRADPRISGLFETELPDCGTPAVSVLKAWREDSDDGSYFWPRIAVPVENIAGKNPGAAIPALFYPPDPEYCFAGTFCGTVFEDVAWASLVRPGWQEPFLRQAILSLDTDQKLSDHYCLGFLEPFLRPGVRVGPLGHATLAYYLASQDKSVTSLASDAVAELALTGKLDAKQFSDALAQFLMTGALPTGRWTKGLSAVAQAGAGDFCRHVITHLLNFAPEQTPRDMGGMLELLYELHIASNTRPERAETLDCLGGLPGGGKVARFAGRLLKLAHQD